GFGLGARFGQDWLDVALADDLAHGALGHVLHRAFWILDIEQIVGSVLDLPEHHKVYVDDILVAGQHQAFLRHIADRARSVPAIRSRGAAHANLDAIDASDLRQFDLLDWIGPAEVEAWWQLAHKFAESEHNAELLGVHPHGEAEEADQDNRNDGGQRNEGPG